MNMKNVYRRRRIALAFAVILIIAAIIGTGVALLYHHFFVAVNDNYDAQMRIGDEQRTFGEYQNAEEAYLRALKFKDGDRNANIRLAEVYVLWEKYPEASERYVILQDIDENDAEIYERLIDLYVEKMDEIGLANEQIIKAFELDLSLESPHIVPPPEFSPKGGIFKQMTSVKLKGPKDYKIRYTKKKNKMPTVKSKRYKKPVKLGINKKTWIYAVCFDKRGLMGWPARERYEIELEFVVDTSAVSYLGCSAKTIMNSVGPLFFEGTEQGGCFYKDNFGKCYYIFPISVFAGEEGKTLSPVKTPLPAGAPCIAVTFSVGQYIVQQSGDFAIDVFMNGINIKDYTVERSGNDGAWHLYYNISGAEYDMTLKDQETISTNQTMTVRLN